MSTLKRFPHLTVVLFSILVRLAAAEPDAPVLGQDAGRDWLELLEAGDRDWNPAKAGFVATGDSNVDYVAGKEVKRQWQAKLGEAFFRNYPQDMRRWRAALIALQAKPKFWRDYPPSSIAGVDEKNRNLLNAFLVTYESKIPVDEAARAEWEQRRLAMIAAIENAPNAPVGLRETVSYEPIHDAMAKAATAADWKAIALKLEAHLAKFSTAKPLDLETSLDRRVKQYIGTISSSAGVEAAIAAAALLMTVTTGEARATAASQMASLKSSGKPLAIGVLGTTYVRPGDARDQACDWETFMNAAKPLEWREPPSWPALVEAEDRRAQELFEMGVMLFTKYPTDSRRWQAAATALEMNPLFATSYPVPEAGVSLEAYRLGLPCNEAARAAWEKRCQELTAQLMSDASIPVEVRESADYASVARQFSAELRSHRPWMELCGELGRHFGKYSGAEGLGGVLAERAKSFVELVARVAPADALAVAKALEPKLAEPVNLQALTGSPIEMKFTAVDGREVDLASFRRRQGSGETRRGKVVLIDFWATWCGPCRAELPNVKRVYEAYRDKGFEVVGISLDQERDRTKFMRLCESEGLAWPQHFDGLGWGNRFGRAYRVEAIPATILLDREGRVANKDARGDKLEPAVRALLGL